MTEVVDRKLTPEQLQKLREAGILGLSPEDEIFHVPKAYRESPDIFPKELWPVFKLKPMDGRESALMEGKTGHLKYTDKGNESTWVSTNGKLRIEILQKHILGWKNFYDAKGNEIVFRHNNGTLHPDCIKRIRQGLQIELFNVITDGSDATEDELSGLEF